MFRVKSKAITLLTYIALFLAVSVIVEASASSLEQRDQHAHLQRMVRKRSPQRTGDDDDTPTRPPPVVIIDDEDEETSTSSSSSTTSSVSSTTSSSSSLSSSSSVSSTESDTSSTTESASSTESDTSTTPTAETETGAAASRSTSIVAGGTRYVTADEPEETQEPPSMAGAAVSDQDKTKIFTILIAVVASTGGVFILFTIFRKWKLGRSKKFDRRMQPVGYQDKDGADDFAPAAHRHSGASFGSNERARSNPTPVHDFTPGPAHISPVGGYADLSRGGNPFAVASHQNNSSYRY